jgi:hypothetical protein
LHFPFCNLHLSQLEEKRLLGQIPGGRPDSKLVVDPA